MTGFAAHDGAGWMRLQAGHSDEVNSLLRLAEWLSLAFFACGENTLDFPPLDALKCGRGGTHGLVLRIPCECVRACANTTWDGFRYMIKSRLILYLRTLP